MSVIYLYSYLYFCPFFHGFLISCGPWPGLPPVMEKFWNFLNFWKSHWILTKIGKAHGILKVEQKLNLKNKLQFMDSYESMSLHGSFSNSKLSVCRLRGHGFLWHGHGKVMEKSWNLRWDGKCCHLTMINEDCIR